jgi:adenylate cyclase class 2
MPQEKEAKFKVASFAALRRELKAMGATCLGTVIQTDRYFDSPDGSLRKRDRGLRLRTVRPLRGARRKPSALLTYKGPRRKGPIKIRRELEAPVADPDALASALSACGLAVSLTIEKRRASYRLGRCRVELDELPVLGRFVEIEGPDERTILAACRKLGLTGEPITTPYTHLAVEHLRRRGLRSRELRFP